MFFGDRELSRARRRGVVLILILGMLALMALIGVTFATFAGQSLVNTRNFAAGVNAPNAEQLMDYALSQLINDTNNPLSAIRGHSLLRDMYGNDSTMGRRYDQFQIGGAALAQGSAAGIGCFLTTLPNGTPLTMQFKQASPANAAKPFDMSWTASYSTSPATGLIQYTTNIPTAANNPAFYGLDFTRWILRIPGSGGAVAPISGTVNATYEVIEDDYSNSVVNGFHVFTLAPADPIDSTTNLATRVYNSPQSPQITGMPAVTVPSSGTITLAHPLGNGGGTVQFYLDGRYMRAFNGPGMTAYNFVGMPDGTYGGAGQPHNNAGYGNFRLNGNLLPLAFAQYGSDGTNPPSAANPPAVPGPAYGDPSAFGMDEDYDACDLENWFLALQSADGSVMIPSFHRPGILTQADWTNNNVMSAAKILRPRAADHYTAAFPADPSTPDAYGRLTYDVDNDGDGITDSVWLDLGYPVLRDTRGQAYKPLFAFMVLGLNGRLPLNTAGNLQSRDFQRVTSSATAAPGAGVPNPNNLPTPAPFQYDYYPQNFLDGPTWSHASHLGYSVNEINPLFALQNAPNLVYGQGTYGTSSQFTQFDVPTTLLGTMGDVTANGGVGNPQNARVLGTAPYLYSGSTGNITVLPAGINPGVGIDVVQLRNLLAGTVPAGTGNQDSNYWLVGGAPVYVPDGMYEASDQGSNGVVNRTGIAAVPGRWGEPNAIPTVLDNNGGTSPANGGNGMPVVKQTTTPANNPPNPAYATITSTYPVYDNPVRAGKSAVSVGTLYNPNFPTWLPVGIGDSGDDDYDALDFPFPPHVSQTPTVTPPYAASMAEGTTTFDANGNITATTGDIYDGASAFMMPVERIRRFFSPIDAMGVGRVVSYEDFPPRNAYDFGNGFDYFGRVMYFRHFRPAGLPKTITYPAATQANLAASYQAMFPNTANPTLANMSTQIGDNQPLNQPVATGPVPFSSLATNPQWDTTTNIYRGFMSALFPIPTISKGTQADNNSDMMVAVASAMPYDLVYYTPPGNPAPAPVYGTPLGYAFASAAGQPATWTNIPQVLPVPFISTTNPANLNTPDDRSPATMSLGVNSGQGPVLVVPDPVNNPLGPVSSGVATVVNGYPTYPSYRTVTSGATNTNVPMPAASLNKDEADEMVPPQYGTTSFDMPFGPADLEWLYRMHDVDGAQLTSRLSSLAPISFINPQDGLTRRRMFSVDVHETIAPAFAPDNQPPLAYDAVNGVFAEQANAYNSRFTGPFAAGTGNSGAVWPPSASLTAINYIDQSTGATSPNYQNSNAITLYPNPLSYPPSQGMIAGPTNGTYTTQKNANSNTYQLPPIGQPAIGSRDRKINLNYPLPVSNDPAEPVRQKWIRETYQYFKAVLPPQAIDTPQELAQLSQFVVNIIDFRDPDCSSTRFVNTDLMVLPATATAHSQLLFADRGVPVSASSPTQFIHYPFDPTIYDEQVRAYQPRYGNPLAPGNDANNNPFVIGLQSDWSSKMTVSAGPPPVIGEFLVQHGMEFSPLALNEALAYQYQPAAANGPNPVARLAIEVANMLTDDGTAQAGATTTDNSESDLTTAMLDGWDFVVMNDGYGYGRPDPITGELPLPGLLNGGTFYPTNNNQPLCAAYPSSSTATPATLAAPPTTFQAIISSLPYLQPDYTKTPATPPANNGSPPAPPAANSWPQNVFALQSPNAANAGQFTQRAINGLRDGAAVQQNNANLANANSAGGGSFFQFGWTSSAIAAGEAPAFPPNDATFPVVFGLPVPAAYANPPANAFTAGNTIWLWVYLRRPANPFDTRPYAYREMVTVDAIRIPFTYAGGAAKVSPYSVQRLQPYRGGHLVPILPGANGMGAGANNPVPNNTCWGYSEQTANGDYPSTIPQQGTQANNNSGGVNTTGMTVTLNAGTAVIPHTFAVSGNSSTKNGTNTLWDVARDYFVFNDRDFVSVAELTLVPGSPPGLFTKQFVENNDPWDINTTTAGTTTVGTPPMPQPYTSALQPSSGVASPDPVAAPASPTRDASPFPVAESQTYPYLVDRFFYSGASVAPPANNPGNLPYPSLVGNWTGDGWYKLLEFVEVPSSANGAIGAVARGDNFDWLRQDLKPGLLNLNLVIDEEVFFGLMDELRLNDALNTSYASTVSLPLVVTQIDASGYPVVNQGATGPPGGYNGFHNISDVITLDPTGGPANGGVGNGMGKLGRGYTYFDTKGAETHGIKAAFADFLKLRSGGSGFLFAWGSGATGSGPVQQYNAVAGAGNLPAWMTALPQPQPGLLTYNQYGWVATGGGTPVARERPFRSFSARDINDTILRPATLPPSLLTYPGNVNTPTPTTTKLYSFFPPYQFFDTFGNPSYGGATVTPSNPSPTAAAPNNLSAANPQTLFVMDPGLRNPFFDQPLLSDPNQILTQLQNQVPAPVPAPTFSQALANAFQNYAKLPPLIPVRRLFEVPDFSNGTLPPAGVNTNHISGAAEYLFSPTNDTLNAGPPASLTGPYNYLPNQAIYHEQLFNATANLILQQRNITPPGSPTFPNAQPITQYLGQGLQGAATNDNRQHPYFRTELLQKVMNLTTVRTHQFAVWITIGFFEVLQPGSAATGTPDFLGGEIGLVQGTNVRFRSFFLLDRTRATGFDQYEPGDFRDVVTYRRRIE